MMPSAIGDDRYRRATPNPKVVKALMFLWLACYTALVYAASFSEIIKGFDYESLMWAAITALIGGGARTMVTLMGDKMIVLTTWRELLRDAIAALIGGMVAYVILSWLVTIWPGLFVSSLQILIIGGVGASKGRWQTLLGDVVSDGVVNLRQRVRGATNPLPPNDTEAPSSVRAPLEGK